MKIPKQVQNAVLVLVIVALAFIAYTIFANRQPEAVLTTTETSELSAPDQDLIALLLELKSISLDNSLFTSPAFASLQDFSQELIPEPVGRPNPFEALPGQVGAKAGK
jgi:hypothetical protein